MSSAEPKPGHVYRHRCGCGFEIIIGLPPGTKAPAATAATAPARPANAGATVQLPAMVPVATRTATAALRQAPLLDTGRPVALPPPAAAPRRAEPKPARPPPAPAAAPQGQVMSAPKNWSSLGAGSLTDDPFAPAPIPAQPWLVPGPPVPSAGSVPARTLVADESLPSLQPLPPEIGGDEFEPAPAAVPAPRLAPAVATTPEAKVAPPAPPPAGVPAEGFDVELQWTEAFQIKPPQAPAPAPAPAKASGPVSVHEPTSTPEPTFMAALAAAAGARLDVAWGVVAVSGVVALVAIGLIVRGAMAPKPAAPVVAPAVVAPAQAPPRPPVASTPVVTVPLHPAVVEAKAAPAPAPAPAQVAAPAPAAPPPVAPTAARVATPPARPAPTARVEEKPAARKPPVAQAPEKRPVRAPPPAAPPAEKAARPAARAPEPPAAAPAAAVATPAPAPARPPASQALTPMAVQRALARQKAAFDRCVELALTGPGGQALAGRKIGLLIAVASGGGVDASEVEEPEIESSPLGACLRKAAERLAFPPFEGEPVGIRIPLQLSASGPGGRT